MQKLECVSLFAGILFLITSAPYNAMAQKEQQHRNSGYEVLHSFQGNPDANGNFDPLLVTGMTADEKGTIFGAAQQGGSLVCITVGGICLAQVFQGAQFQLDRDGHLTSFPNDQTTAPFVVGAAQGPLLLDASGNPIFATQAGGVFNGTGGVFNLNTRTRTVTALAEFVGKPIDGNGPNLNPIRDAAGNLYGTTTFGGQNPTLVCVLPDAFFQSGLGCGTVYKLDAKTHQETVLHTFSFDDGHEPFGLALDPSGNLIGSTQFGDNTDCRAGFLQIGCGEIFSIDRSGNFNFVYEFDHTATCPFHFCPPPPPGPAPELLGWSPSFVVVDQEGNIFGVTNNGGNFGLGVIFQIDAQGNYSVLHHFAGPGDGFATEQLLLRNHQLFGINADGGNTLDCDFGFGGCGTIFQLDTQTGKFTVLHTFSKNEEGTTPTALAFDENGDLIGSNLFGGNGVFDPTVCTGGGGCGNVFRLKLNGGRQ